MDLYIVNPLVQDFDGAQATLAFDQHCHVGLKRGSEWLEVETEEEEAECVLRAPVRRRTKSKIEDSCWSILNKTPEDVVCRQRRDKQNRGQQRVHASSDGLVPAPGSRGDGGRPMQSRKDKCLTVLARNFLDLMPEHPHYLEINWASRALSVPKRRIYDITGVLGGIGLVEKRKNHVRRTAKWKEIVSESAAQAARELADWHQRDAMLDEQIERVKRGMACLQARFQGLMYVTEADVLRSLPQSQPPERVFAVHWDAPGTQMHVETSDTHSTGIAPTDPAAGASPVEPPRHAITFKSPEGRIECAVLNMDDAVLTAHTPSSLLPHSPNNVGPSPSSESLLDTCSSPAMLPCSIQPQNVAACTPGLAGGACGQDSPALEARFQELVPTPSSTDGICHKLEIDQYWDDGSSGDGGIGLGFSDMFLPLHHNQCMERDNLDDLSLFLGCFQGGDALQV